MYLWREDVLISECASIRPLSAVKHTVAERVSPAKMVPVGYIVGHYQYIWVMRKLENIIVCRRTGGAALTLKKLNNSKRNRAWSDGWVLGRHGRRAFARFER